MSLPNQTAEGKIDADTNATPLTASGTSPQELSGAPQSSLFSSVPFLEQDPLAVSAVNKGGILPSSVPPNDDPDETTRPSTASTDQPSVLPPESSTCPPGAESRQLTADRPEESAVLLTASVNKDSVQKSGHLTEASEQAEQVASATDAQQQDTLAPANEPTADSKADPPIVKESTASGDPVSDEKTAPPADSSLFEPETLDARSKIPEAVQEESGETPASAASAISGPKSGVANAALGGASEERAEGPADTAGVSSEEKAAVGETGMAAVGTKTLLVETSGPVSGLKDMPAETASDGAQSALLVTVTEHGLGEKEGAAPVATETASAMTNAAKGSSETSDGTAADHLQRAGVAEKLTQEPAITQTQTAGLTMEAVDETGETADRKGETADETKETADETRETAGETADETKETAHRKGETADETKETADETKETAGETADETKETAGDVGTATTTGEGSLGEATVEKTKTKKHRRKKHQDVFSSKPTISKADAAASKPKESLVQSQSVFESPPRPKSIAHASHTTPAPSASARTLFESSAAQSKADAKANAPAAPHISVQTVYESTSTTSSADVTYASPPRVSVNAKSVYESQVSRSSADVRAFDDTHISLATQQRSVYESHQSKSMAHVRASDPVPTTSASAGIFVSKAAPSTAAVRAFDPVTGPTQERTLYANEPAPSSAHVRANEPPSAACQAGVFTNVPVQSPNVIKWSDPADKTASDRTVFESIPASVNVANVKWNAPVQTTVTSTVFESRPKASTADAGTYKEVSSSGSEYTDSSEDESEEKVSEVAAKS